MKACRRNVSIAPPILNLCAVKLSSNRCCAHLWLVIILSPLLTGQRSGLPLYRRMTHKDKTVAVKH
jgi:hypothetical protein